jgi:hypothetical protein
MTIAEPSDKPETKQPLVRIEVEVPKDAVPALLKHAAALRGEPWAFAKDFKEMLELAPGDDALWDEIVKSRYEWPDRNSDT